MKRGSWALWPLLALLALPRTVAAAPLLVVEFSSADEAAASRLADLIDQPIEQLRMAPPLEPQSLLERARARGVESVVVLDSAGQRVHVLRSRDGTLLTRVVAPGDAASAAYVTAFVAVELLRLSTQIEPGTAEPSPPSRALPEATAADLRAALRLGAQLTWLGAPFAGDVQPTFGVGLWLADPRWSRLWWLAELECAPLGRAEAATAGGRIVLARTDVGLRAGLAYEIGRFSLLAFARGRAATTSAEFLGPGGAVSSQWTWGLGAGIEVELRVVGWAKLYASSAVDLALTRSEYRIEGVRELRDPALLANSALGLSFFEDF